jgi:hypothetical protein
VTDFQGHPTLSLENDHLRLECLSDVGPRVVRLFAKGSDHSLLADVPTLGMDTEYGRFNFMGGHRLWHAPEAIPRTYIPDQPVEVEILEYGLGLAAAPEPGTGIAKGLEIHLDPDQAAVTLSHKLRNQGEQPVELAPWAITMLRLGGLAILPQPTSPVDADGLLPNRNLVLWPYTNIEDVRLKLNNDFVLLDARPAMPPCKVGYLNRNGWMAYWLDGLLFVKRFAWTKSASYPDGGCNAEVYCNDRFIELESLAPLTRLEPGDQILHTEAWEVYDSLPEDLNLPELELRSSSVE